MKEGGQRLGARSEMDQSLVFSLVSCAGSLGALVSFVLLLVLHGISLAVLQEKTTTVAMSGRRATQTCRETSSSSTGKGHSHYPKVLESS